MATAMTMDATGLQFPGAKRKWSAQGVGPNKQRYTNDGRKVVVNDERRKYYAKKRTAPKTVPRAPYNDSSFLMRVRRSGGLELSEGGFEVFPKDSSYKLDTYEDFVDVEDYGYGSMTGLIRLRGGDQSSSDCSTVEHGEDDEHVCVERPSVHDSVEEMERRLDRGVSRFVMTRPAPRRELAQLQVARQDSHIQCLEEENLVLRDRLFLIQQEVEELRRRFQEEQSCVHVDESDESDD